MFFHRKLPKTAFRLQATSEKRGKQSVARGFSSKIAKKQHFACERRAENAKNSPSLVVFHRKLPKTAFRLQATSKKWEKLCFGASRKVENQKNSVSGCPDELFFVKMNRRGVPKPQNFEKQAFGESRSSKNLKSESSGCPEKAKLDISKRKVKPKE